MGQSTTYHCDECKEPCRRHQLTQMYVAIGTNQRSGDSVINAAVPGEGIRLKEVCDECKKKIGKLIGDWLNKNFGHVQDQDECDEHG